MNSLQFFVHNDPDAVRVELAGSLRGADVETVRQAWQRAVLLSARAAMKPPIVDITFVTEADEHGRALLVVMHRSGARIIARSPDSSAIAQPIVSAALPAEAGILTHTSAGNRHAGIECTGLRDRGALEDLVR